MKKVTRYMGLVLLMAGAALAQQSNPLKITLSETPVDLPEGRKAEWDQAGNLVAAPGDFILFTLMAENVGSENAHNVDVVDPIPPGTEFVIGSAKGRNTSIVYSIDSGNTYVKEPTIEVKDEQGRLVKKPAPAAMYTHVKWTIQDVMQPKEKKGLELRVRVIAN